MYDLIVKKVDDVNMFIECEAGIAHELQEFFSYKADGYRFHPKYKAKMWDGNIKLFGAWRRTLYIGLLHHLKIFAKNSGYNISIDPMIESKTDISPKDIVDYLHTLKLHAHGKPITPRDYQYYAIYHAIYHKRSTIVAPTSAGKSLNIYGTVRWYCDNYKKKVLIIVPTVTLVTQMYADFGDYSSMVKWNHEDEVHKISAGEEKDGLFVKITTNDEKTYKFSGNVSIRLINSNVSTKLAKDITEDDEIDDRWLSKFKPE